MKYILLVSHGMMAPGLHNALGMLAGENREDILSTSLKNGMGADEFAENVRKCVSVGSPLTTTADVLASEGLLGQTRMIGGMNLPLVLSAAVTKDTMDTGEMIDMLIPESREMLQEFTVEAAETEDEI